MGNEGVPGSRLVSADDLRKEGFPVFGSKVLVAAFERSRWRGGRFACYAPRAMPRA